MTSIKKSNLSLKGRYKNKKGIIIVITITLIISAIGLYFYNRNNNLLVGNVTYYTGDVYSANHAANMIDYLDEGNNLIISPFNVNTTLAILYNGTDNNSNKELRRYFKKTPVKINEEMDRRISSLTANNKEKTKFNDLYESFMEELNNYSYKTLNLQTISMLTLEEKQELTLLLRKIELSYENIVNKNYTEKNIKDYQLSNEEKTYNNYNIKELLDNVISNYEHYNVHNEIENYTGIFINNLDKNMIEKEFTNNTSMYNYNLQSITEQSISNNSPTNNDNKQQRSISRIIDYEEVGENDIIITNKLHFNYGWDIPFNHKNIKDTEFFNIDNKVQAAEMMYSKQYTYLENSKAKGFKYDFENSKYSFIAILPKKTGDFQLSTLNLDSFLLSKKEGKVLIGIPKMTYQSEINIEDLLSKYNINEIFSEKANFSKISSSKLSVNKITQKNNLTIAEKGTIESNLKQNDSQNIFNDEYKEKIILNRPYAYLVINNETNDILFIGKVVRMNDGS